MKPIVTLTLNPAVDASCDAETVHAVRKVRTSNERFDPGGGGINVARVVGELGGRAFAVYLAGGRPGDVLDELVAAAGVQFHRVPTAEPTRISHTVYERSSGHEFRFTPEGPRLREAEWQAALSFLELLDFDFVVASGSVPRGVPADFYAQVGALAAAKGARLVVDTSGAGLQAALKAGVYLAKPSLGELRAVVGREVADEAIMAAAAQELVQGGAAELLAVTLGADGALLATRDGVVRLRAPPVEVRSAVGAGDSFVGAMTWALAKGLDAEAAFAYGVAAGTATALTPGTALCRRDDVERLYTAVRSQAGVA
jgi:6-phosphofructokinase 2